jgi:hypothetical protein
VTTPPPLTCTLDEAGRSERAGAVAALEREAQDRAAGVALDAQRVPAERREQVEAFVREESACCPFFGLNLAEREGAIELRVSVPNGGEPALDALVAGFTAGRSAFR